MSQASPDWVPGGRHYESCKHRMAAELRVSPSLSFDQAISAVWGGHVDEMRSKPHLIGAMTQIWDDLGSLRLALFPAARGSAIANDDDGDRIVNIAAYRRTVPTTIPWVVYPLVYTGGVTLLSGPPKGGKSTLMAQLQRCRETGEAFLDQPVVRGPTLLVTEEGGVAVVFKTEGLTKLDVFDRRAAQGETFIETLNRLIRWVDRHPTGVVFIDTLAIWAGIDNENDASAVSQSLSLVMQVAQQADVAIILVHHVRKGGGKDGEAIRGSGAMLATVDISAELKRAEDDSDERTLDVMGRVILPERYLLGFDRSTMRYSRLDPIARANAEIEADLVGIPATGPGVREKETGLTWRRLNQLCNKGRVKKLEQGPGKPNLYWSIPPVPVARILRLAERADG